MSGNGFLAETNKYYVGVTDKVISETLREIGINPMHKGYKFIIDCINYLMSFGDKSNDIKICDLYKYISNKYNCSFHAAERNIRTAKIMAFKYNDIERNKTLRKILKCESLMYKYGSMSSTDFIGRLNEYFKYYDSEVENG